VRVVQNCNDSGSGSLREAYASSLDGDNVDLTQLACSTITLTSGPITSAPDAGFVILQGPPDHTLTLNGNHADRVIVHHGSRIAPAICTSRPESRTTPPAAAASIRAAT
jgi:hypothetical protein